MALVWLFIFLYGIIIARLWFVQIYNNSFFRVLARHQYTVEMVIDPSRGIITDRHGQLLALNREMPSAFVVPHQWSTPHQTKAFLSQYYPAVFEALKKYPERKFFWLERKLTPERRLFIETCLKEAHTQDVQFINEPSRYYPSIDCAQILGFTDSDNKGIAGLEQLFDKRLRGTPTNVSLEKDARSLNLYFEKKIKKKGEEGLPIALTIDKTLNYLVFEKVKESVEYFNAELGSALILDPDSGEILAMTNYPSFDPNQKIPQDLEVTKNAVVTECYELGSVFKIFAALACLEENVVTLDESINCEGSFSTVKGFRVGNYLENQKGVQSFADVVRYSSNIGIAKVIHRIGHKFYDHLRRLGFGEKTGVECLGERNGFVNHPARWSASSLTVMSFGYEIMASLLQLGVATSIIANGGYAVQPILVKNSFSSVPLNKQALYRPEVVRDIRHILGLIGERYPVPGCAVLGKTGTARIAKEGGYSTTDHVYTYAGIVEKGENYRRVVVTFIKKPEKNHLWASQVSAPLFQKVAERMVMHECGIN